MLLSYLRVTRSPCGAFSQRYSSFYFFQIFALRAKIWKKKSLTTLLPQAIPADHDATA
jgi:hypothetical protein